MRVLGRVATMAVAAMLLSLTGGPAATAADTQVSVADVADTYTAPNAPTTDYGASSSLGVYQSPSITSVLRFVLPVAPSGQVLSSATLRVHTSTIGSAGSVNAVNVRTASDSWSETGTFYANRPAVSGPVLGMLAGGTAPNSGYDIALNPAGVSALLGGSTTFALEGTGTDSLWLWSRTMAVSLRPVLLLTFSAGTPVPPDTTPPSTPAGLSATVNGSSVGLSWQASTDDVGVSGYAVYRSATAGFTAGAATKIADAAGTSYTHSGRPVGTWYYRVTAVDAAGNVSGASDAASATVQAPPPPPPPASQVTVADTADTYTASNAPTTDYGTSSSLGVYKSPAITSVLRFVLPAAGAGQTLSSATLRVHTSTIATAGSADAATVRTASDSWTETGTFYANRPAVSGPVLGTLSAGTVPDASYDITLDPTGVSALLGASTTFALEGTGTDSLWLWSRTMAASLRPVLLLTFSAGTPVPPDTTPPSTPAGLAATVNGSSVGLSWQASTDDVGVSGYSVYRSDTAGFTAGAATKIADAAGTSYTDAGRPAGTWYYRVTAVDAAGNVSGASDAASATVQAPPASVSVLAVGDIACVSGTPVTSRTCRFPEVANTISAAQPYRFLELGDMQYQSSTLSEIMAPGAYNDTFGPLKPITLPTLGNHEFYGGTTGYFDYFYGSGGNSGPFGTRGAGYYAATLGSWQFISLDSECDAGGVPDGCAVGSPQYVWLQNQLTSSPGQCTIVIEHRPRWSTGASHGSYPAMSALWDLMAANHVDIVLAGHNHIAEAFKPIGASGSGATPALAADGIRAFTVGTGGAELQNLTSSSDPLISALDARSNSAFGPLQLNLGAGSYSWAFMPIAGMTFTNNATTGSFSGNGTCH